MEHPFIDLVLKYLIPPYRFYCFFCFIIRKYSAFPNSFGESLNGKIFTLVRIADFSRNSGKLQSNGLPKKVIKIRTLIRIAERFRIQTDILANVEH